MIMENNINRDSIKIALRGYVSLVYAGVDIVKELLENEEELIPTYKVWITVPEKSELPKQNDDETFDINTSDGLAKSAKLILGDIFKVLLCSRFSNIYKEDPDVFDTETCDKLLSEYDNNKSKSLQVFSKVREGDIWNEEKAQKALDTITEKIKKNSGFKEV